MKKLPDFVLGSKIKEVNFCRQLRSHKHMQPRKAEAGNVS